MEASGMLIGVTKEVIAEEEETSTSETKGLENHEQKQHKEKYFHENKHPGKQKQFWWIDA